MFEKIFLLIKTLSKLFLRKSLNFMAEVESFESYSFKNELVSYMVLFERMGAAPNLNKSQAF